MGILGYNTLMLVMAFIQWWYGPGWRDAGARLLTRMHETYLNFSMPILLRTMFAPWRRIISAPGASLQDRARAVVDNAVSRAVGFSMRLFTLLAACILILLYAIVGGLILILWPVIPLLGPGLIVGGLL
jgi:hypothetical protein